jgi:hypothetical protein
VSKIGVCATNDADLKDESRVSRYAFLDCPSITMPPVRPKRYRRVSSPGLPPFPSTHNEDDEVHDDEWHEKRAALNARVQALKEAAGNSSSVSRGFMFMKFVDAAPDDEVKRLLFEHLRKSLQLWEDYC